MPEKLLGGSDEENTLTMLCYSEQYAAQIAMQVTPDLFSTRLYQKIADKALKYLEHYHRPPQAHIRDLLEAELTRSEEREFFWNACKAMDETAPVLQGEYVMERLDTFIQVRKLTKAVDDAADALHAGDLNAARERLYAPEIAQKHEPGVWLHDTPSWLSFLDKKESDYLSSGIEILDERGVRPAPGELFLFVGPPGSGKSWYLIEVGRRAVIEGKKVLHISLENSLAITCQRYTQAFLAMTREDAREFEVQLFRRDSLGRFQSFEGMRVSPDSLENAARSKLVVQLRPYQNRGRLLVKWFPTATLTIAQLRAFIDSLSTTEKFKPDIVLLDYADIMAVSLRDYRLALGGIVRDLRGIAGAYNFALVTATQGNRMSASARIVTATMIAEDWSKVGTADIIITRSQTAQERERGIARILVAKARNAQDHWIALISQSYATGQFCLDSLYFNKHVEDEVARVTGETDDHN